MSPDMSPHRAESLVNVLFTLFFS